MHVLQAAFRNNGWSKFSGVSEGFFQVKAQRFDAWGYHHHLEGVVMVTSGVLGIWVKTLDLAVSTTTVHASLPS
jgi:hypothetical protein